MSNSIPLAIPLSRTLARSHTDALGLGRFSLHALDPALYLRTDRNVVADGAVQFNAGDASLLQISIPPAIIQGSVSGSWRSGWLYLDSFTTGYAIDHLSSVAGWGLWLGSDNSIRASIADASGITSVSIAPPGTGSWFFWYMDWDGATLRLSINNGSFSSLASGFAPNSDPFRVGGSGASGLYFDGRQDELCGGGGTLTAAEITWLYNGGAGRIYSEVAAHPTIGPKLGFYYGFNGRDESGVWHDSHGSNHLTEQFAADSTATEILPAQGIASGQAVDGDYLTSITGISRNAYVASQPVFAKRPRWRADGPNGYPYLELDGGDDYLLGEMPLVAQTTSRTIFAVMRQVAEGSGTQPFLSLGDGNWYVAVSTSGRIAASHESGSSQQATFSSVDAVTLETWHVVTFRWTVSSSDTRMQMWVDGTSVADQTYGHIADLSDKSTVHLGAYNGATGGFATIDLADLIVPPYALTDNQLSKAHRHLARRYALTLAG